MRLKSLYMNNFRQYIGENTIEFAGVNEGPNVTLIWGPNGYGKTGVFRAIMFCLYGDLVLEQDGFLKSDSGAELILVNEKLLEKDIGKRVTATVMLRFEHESSEFELERKVSALMSNKGEEPMQEPGSVILNEKNSIGNSLSTIEDIGKVEEKITQILSRRVRDYFLFDGERMEKLTRYGDDQREEVQRGIMSLLQIDALEIAVQGLKKQERQLTQKIRTTASGELEIVSEQLQKINIELDTLEEDLRINLDEVRRMGQREKEIEGVLQKVSGLETKQELRRNIRENLATVKSDQEKNKQDLQQLLEIGGSYIASPVVIELKTDLDGKISRGELPTDVRESFIDHLLDVGNCICERCLEDGSPERSALQRYKEQKIAPGMEAAYQLASKLTSLVAKNDGISDKFDSETTRYQLLKQRTEDLEKDLMKLNEELKDVPEVTKYAVELERIGIDRKEKERKIAEQKYQKEKKIEERKSLQEKEKVLSQRDEISKKYNSQRVEIEKAHNKLSEIQELYEKKVKEELSEIATEVFTNLADQNTQKSLAEIKIDDDFQLDVLNNSGRGMLSQISSGQRQIVSLAYICALIKLGARTEIPLLMDTPLGRLSGVHRDNCLRQIPKFTPQWIMLGTDTEITAEETTALRKSGYWGKVYEIRGIADRESEVKNVDIQNWVPIRGK
jgi:DNA sulfur modification protein DndD